ncbi:MAG: SNF2-related protein [Verrucomicrobiota bacterium]|nr:SNF2-related protein [Verrucomicrobiota bacterium]
MFVKDSNVRHKKHGIGVVLADLGDSVLVRFETEIQSCLPSDLEQVAGVRELIKSGQHDSLARLLVRLQALCIKSVNDQWGVFARSKIDLLPHQLWVCRQARMKDPCRLMIADDVGLGKTIEAGLILSSMFAANRLRRLLILVPASLVEQWQARMKDMFDIRAQVYSSEVDTPKNRFWEVSDCVVASLDTLKMDNPGRKERFFSAEPWDLVVVDEAHHLNNEKKIGATQGYALIESMEEQEKFRDLLFFTGTPHKGKNYSFLSLMKLLAPKEFNPDGVMELQLGRLKNYMIRNNKYNVTDLQGNKLFQVPIVKSMTYSYTPEESEFYGKLTEFIENGMAYAGSLNRETGSIVMFVLITMQKLASSSVAAISNALRRRIQRFADAKIERARLELQLKELDEMEDEFELDRKARLEERLFELSSFVQIGENEQGALKKLLSLAERITEETKLKTIMATIEADYPSEPIVFFTEYKATQSAIMSVLMAKYGPDCVTFINGDERLDGVTMPNGSKNNLCVSRFDAKEAFNEGKFRFIVSTEAAGEGIDLQENCHVLFHVDLPWNPMRLHQRVGRLNRYGQKRRVEVRSFRNPDTVESRIWDKLNDKLEKINLAFGAVMEQKEDMFLLVLGMASQKDIQGLFANAPKNADDETLSKWFDAKAGTIGGKDVVKTVQRVFGSAARFDYHQVSQTLPRVDLQDLVPFWKNLLAVKERRLSVDGDLLTFNTPDDWKGFGILRKYEAMQFTRKPKDKNKILGSGHRIFDMGVADAIAFRDAIAVAGGIECDYLVYSVCDKVTDGAREKGVRTYACEISHAGSIRVLADWEFLVVLNKLKPSDSECKSAWSFDDEVFSRCEQAIVDHVMADEFSPKVPVVTLSAALIQGGTC